MISIIFHSQSLSELTTNMSQKPLYGNLLHVGHGHDSLSRTASNRYLYNGIIKILSEDLSDESLEILNILNVQIAIVLSLIVCKIYMHFLSNIK